MILKSCVSKALIGSKMFCLCTLKSCKFENFKPQPLFFQEYVQQDRAVLEDIKERNL